MFLRKYKDKQIFCEGNILTEGVFVTQLSSNAGISFWRIVCLTTNCLFMGELFVEGIIFHLAQQSKICGE
jgi:hypothetical protein